MASAHLKRVVEEEATRHQHMEAMVKELSELDIVQVGRQKWTEAEAVARDAISEWHAAQLAVAEAENRELRARLDLKDARSGGCGAESA